MIDTARAAIIATILRILIVSTPYLLSHLLLYFVDRLADAIPPWHILFIPTPVDEPRFAYDEFIGHRTPKAAIVGVIAVVTHHEELPFRDLHRRKFEDFDRVSPIVSNGWIVMDAGVIFAVRVFDPKESSDLDDALFGVVGFDVVVSFMGVEIEHFVVQKEHIASHSDTAFDVVDFGVDGIAKDDDIASFGFGAFDEVSVTIEIGQDRNFKPWNVRGRHAVGKLFDEEVIANEESVFHTSTWDHEGLGDEEDDEKDDDDSAGPGVGPVVELDESIFQRFFLCLAALRVF